MKTKFSTLDKKKESKKTVFKKVVNEELEIEISNVSTEFWDNVLHIGFDEDYGDVFKCWDNSTENNFTIAFGEKGDEFDN